jgi:hypothetical protein
VFLKEPGPAHGHRQIPWHVFIKEVKRKTGNHLYAKKESSANVWLEVKNVPHMNAK